jgi:hypothetical protein
MAFNPENSEKLGKRSIEQGEIDPLIKAEAIKLCKYAHYDMLLGAKTALGLDEDEELTKEQIHNLKAALFESKYEYLLSKETNEDAY